MKIKLIDLYIILGIIAVIAYFLNVSKEYIYVYIILSLIMLFPLGLLFIFRIALSHTDNIILHISLKIIGFLFTVIILLFSGFTCISLHKEPHKDFNPDKYPTLEQYSQGVDYLTDKKYRTKHFPDKIPEKAQNYVFKIDSDKIFNYLMFDIDSKYIQKIENKNKNNVFRKEPVEKICKTFRICGLIPKKIFDNGEIFILNTDDYDWNYTSGFIVSENRDKIMFFYSNMTLAQRFASVNDYKPSLEDYKYDVRLLTYAYKIEHFPKEIPPGAQNYDFNIENNWDNYNISSLRFNADNKYIENTLKKNKPNLYKTVKYSDAEKYFRHINSHFDKRINGNPEDYTLYVMKNKNNDNSYTSGIITSEKNREIIFFYANYCMEEGKTIEGDTITR